MFRYAIISLLLLTSLITGCSFTPTYKTLTYEYFVPPMAQMNGEHASIAIKVEGEKVKQPSIPPVSERLRLKWMDDYDKADIQVRIFIKPSVLKHNHNYYHRSTEYKDLRPMKAINQARIKAHVQTNYEVTIHDRKKDEQLLFFQGGRQYYFESLEDTEDLKGSERTVVKDFNKHVPFARIEVVDYIWQNMKGNKYSLLKKHKAKIMAEEFKLLIEHPERMEFQKAWKALQKDNKKLAAPMAYKLYDQVLAKLQAIKESDRGSEERILIDGAQLGIKATEYINNNQYDPRIRWVEPISAALYKKYQQTTQVESNSN